MCHRPVSVSALCSCDRHTICQWYFLPIRIRLLENSLLRMMGFELKLEVETIVDIVVYFTKIHFEIVGWSGWILHFITSLRDFLFPSKREIRI